MARGLMPQVQRLAVQGWRGSARAAMPTFTNVNNSAIVTGVPPAVHGIGGNFFYDTSIGQEVMMNSSKFLRVPTLFPAAQVAGRKVKRGKPRSPRTASMRSKRWRARHRPFIPATPRCMCSRPACNCCRLDARISCTSAPPTSCSTSTCQTRQKPSRSMPPSMRRSDGCSHWVRWSESRPTTE
ncbi:MAG: alkaline phosphatase family protein [Verrucomicrobia bacterium]|nr:alkaline phosphatase family protein [Verrucomicrobiota bacterium]